MSDDAIAVLIRLVLPTIVIVTLLLRTRHSLESGQRSVEVTLAMIALVLVFASGDLMIGYTPLVIYKIYLTRL
jgi:hypothetical protein